MYVRRRLLFLTALLALTLPAASTTADTLRLDRIGFTPTIPSGASLIGGLPGATTLHVTVALKPRDPGALTTFARQVSTPGSRIFGRYIRPAEFARRFGAGSAQIAAVSTALRAQGLKPGAVSANRLSIPVSATAAQLGQALSFSFVRLRLANGTDAVLNNAAPALPSNVAGLVQGVLGLSSLGGPHPLGVRATATATRVQPGARLSPLLATGGPQPCAAATAAAPKQSAYTADQIASAYGFPGVYRAGNLGRGVTVALFELESYDPADIATYQSCYGTHAPVSNVAVDGGPGTGPGSGEAAFDIEQVIGLAPKANVLVYGAKNSSNNGPGAGPYDVLSTIVSQDRAQVISSSFGQCEADEGATAARAENTLLQEAAAQGQSFVAASGDSGSEGCSAGSPLQNQLAAGDPAGQPFATGVGGTTLAKLGPPPAETVWNNGGSPLGLVSVTSPGASGGGISSIFPMSAYQSTAAASLSVIGRDASRAPCGARAGFCRQTPDVSADADPHTGYLIFYNGSGAAGAGAGSGWQGSGGTSGSAPLFGALFALADASRQCAGVPIGFANPALYRAASGSYGADFHDVVTGNNDLTASHSGAYGARAGYDMATGLGTPDAANLVPALCSDSLRLGNPGTKISTVGSTVGFTLDASDSRGVALEYSASGLPPGLSIDRRTGRFTGKPRRAGTYTTTVVVADSAPDARAVAFRWVIRGAPKLSGPSLSGLRARRPILRFRLAAARFAPALKQISIRLAGGSRPRAVKLTAASGRRLRFGENIRHGVLTLRLRSASDTARVTVSYAATRTRRVKLTVTTTDATGGATALSPSVRPRS